MANEDYVNEDEFLRQLSEKYGASVESSDAERLREYEEGIRGGTTTDRQLQDFLGALESQYNLRGASTSHRSQDSQSMDQTRSYDPRTEPGYRETRDLSGPSVLSQVRPVTSVPPRGPTTPSVASSSYVDPTGRAVPTPGHPDDAYTPDGSPMSPYEYAQLKGNADALQRATDAFYSLTPEQQAEWGKYVNWYQPETWSWLLEQSAAPTSTAGVPGRPNMPGSPTGQPPRREHSSRPEAREAGDMLRNVYDVGIENLSPLARQLRDYLGLRTSREGDAFQRYLDYINQRVPELRGEPFTQTEEAGRRVQAFDNLNRQRGMAKARVLEELGTLGHAPTSGTVVRALASVDRQFDQLQAQGENQLLLEGTQIRDQRRAQADELMSALTGYGFTSSGLGSELNAGLGTFGNLALGGAQGFGNLYTQLFGLDEQAWRNDVEEDLARSGLSLDLIRILMGGM